MHRSLSDSSTPAGEMAKVREFKAWLELTTPTYAVTAIAHVNDVIRKTEYPSFVVERTTDHTSLGVCHSVADALERIGDDRIIKAWHRQASSSTAEAG